MNDRCLTGNGEPLVRLHQLGETVAKRWSMEDHALSSFTQVAAKTLEDEQPWHDFDVSTLLAAWLESAAHRNRPLNPFSDFPMILYQDERFRVEVLIWMNSTVKIHDHGFYGAFAVMQGRSLHTRFQFSETAQIGPKCASGLLETKAIEVLKRGAVVVIDPAPDFIHSTFHLEAPTVSLVVRTHGGGGVQREYYPPGVALVSESGEPQGAFVARALGMLISFDADRAKAAMLTLCANANAETLFHVFAELPWSMIDREIARAMHVQLINRPGGATLFAALQHEADTRRLFALKSTLDTPEERLLLSATALFADRSVVFDLLARSGIADPAGFTAACILRAADTDRDSFADGRDDFVILSSILSGKAELGGEASPMQRAARTGPFHHLIDDNSLAHPANRKLHAVRLQGVS